MRSEVPGHSAVSMGSENTRAARTASFRVLHMTFGAGLRLPRHHHGDANFVITLRGRFERASSEQRVVCSPGLVFTEPAGEPHTNTFGDAPADVLIVQPAGDMPACSAVERGLFETPAVLMNPRITRAAAEVASELRTQNRYAELAIDGLVLHMLALSLRTSAQARAGSVPRWLDRIVEYIHDEPARRLALTELAALVDVHPAHLAKVFRAAHGVSIARFARTVRLEDAARSLATTLRPIAEIAVQAGFADQSHFTRAFRALNGVTPAQYRRLRNARR